MRRNYKKLDGGSFFKEHDGNKNKLFSVIKKTKKFKREFQVNEEEQESNNSRTAAGKNIKKANAMGQMT